MAIAMALVASACSIPDEVVAADPTLVTAPSTTVAEEASTTVIVTTTVVETTTTRPPVPTPEGYEVSSEYSVETIMGGLDAGTGGLAVDAEGNLYHADFGYGDHVGDTVYKVTPDGNVSEFATSALFDSLTGNTFGSDGRLYQSSFGSSNIATIDPDGTVTLLTDQVRGPTGIVVTDEGRVFVDSCRRNQVFEVFADGEAEVFAGGVGMNCPNGLTIDDDGNLYVVNFNSGFMQRITPDGAIEAIYRFPSGNAHVVHVDGFLFVTARTDHRVYRYEIATGEAVVVAGTGEEGLDDGPGAEATIARPNAIAVGPDGSLYINHGGGDGRNDPVWIRKITSGG
jgi:sugar lactone lactonase YvrE